MRVIGRSTPATGRAALPSLTGRVWYPLALLDDRR